jgi:hypothetical protein
MNDGTQTGEGSAPRKAGDGAFAFLLKIIHNIFGQFKNLLYLCRSKFKEMKTVNGINLKKVQPHNIYELGGRTGGIKTTDDVLVKLFGLPNIAMSEDRKLERSWLLETPEGVRIHIWAYKIPRRHCRDWSTNGSPEIMKKLFPETYKYEL